MSRTMKSESSLQVQSPSQHNKEYDRGRLLILADALNSLVDEDVTPEAIQKELIRNESPLLLLLSPPSVDCAF